MYKTGSVAFQVGFFFFPLVLYRPEKVLNSDVLVSIGLLLCVSLTYSCAGCKSLPKENAGVLFTLFTSVYDYRKCIPWWNSPSVFDVTVWSNILSLPIPCSHKALCFSRVKRRHLFQWNCTHTKYEAHVAASESQCTPDTSKLKKHNISWCMAGIAFSEKCHHHIRENTLTFKNYFIFSEYFATLS